MGVTSPSASDYPSLQMTHEAVRLLGTPTTWGNNRLACYLLQSSRLLELRLLISGLHNLLVVVAKLWLPLQCSFHTAMPKALHINYVKMWAWCRRMLPLPVPSRSRPLIRQYSCMFMSWKYGECMLANTLNLARLN